GGEGGGGGRSKDSHKDDQPLTITLMVSGPGAVVPHADGSQSFTNFGTLNLNPGGSFDYTPVPGFIGDDVFVYRVNDGFRDSRVATLRIHVTAGPPVAVVDLHAGVV